MRSVLRSCLAAALALALLAVAPDRGAASDFLDWGDLVDTAAQAYEDPYRDLTPGQLNDLVTIVRLQERLAAGEVADEARDRIEARLEDLEAGLISAEIKPDWLISQRWIVAERREKAALAGNPALDGASVQLGGFLIPAPPAEDGTPTAYLVPERGMCSHVPPPPPNQLLQLRLAEPLDVQTLYLPVVARGTLEMVETLREMVVVDGMVPMWSAWTMQADSLETLAAPGVSGEEINQ